MAFGKLGVPAAMGNALMMTPEPLVQDGSMSNLDASLIQTPAQRIARMEEELVSLKQNPDSNKELISFYEKEIEKLRARVEA